MSCDLCRDKQVQLSKEIELEKEVFAKDRNWKDTEEFVSRIFVVPEMGFLIDLHSFRWPEFRFIKINWLRLRRR